MTALDKKTVLVLGTGRSGTTWLAGLLAAPFRYRLLFEPFHPEHVEGAAAVADHYYPPDSVPPEVERLCVRALKDEIDSEWIAQGSNRRWGMHRWRFWPRARVAKSIRSNLLIPAYRRILGPNVPIIVLVRQPEAVVESFLRVGFPWATDVETLLAQTEFAERYDLPIDALRALPRTPVVSLAVRWLMENAYLLCRAEELGVRVMRYETMRADPSSALPELCRWAGLALVSDLPERAARRSQTTHPRSPVFSDGSATAVLDADSRETLRRVLALVELELDDL